MSTQSESVEPIKRLAQLISTFSVVPFIGAGCPKALLGGNDWVGITDATAKELGLNSWADLLPTRVAQMYEDKFGRDSLIGFLKPRLQLADFKDELGQSYLALMAMHFMTLYTTNVDNVFEMVFEKYVRPLITVSELDDLRNVLPGSTVLYKYHGCLNSPPSLIWTENDYVERKNDTDFFLNVRLRSDLLTKTLLFIGYSLSDPHIVELLKQMQALYADGMRRSILIAVGDPAKFRAELAKENLDIEVIAPSEIFPSVEPITALGYFLNETAKEVARNYAKRQLDSLFTPSTPLQHRALSEYELGLLEGTCDKLPLTECIDLFRGNLDGCFIPQDLTERVSALASTIVMRAHEEDCELTKLAGLISNLRLPTLCKIYVQAHACTLFVSTTDFTFSFSIGLPDEVLAKFIIADTATDILLKNGKPINGHFADWVAGPLGLDKNDFDSLTPEQQNKIKQTFEQIFANSQRENPITKVKVRPPWYRTKSQIMAQMMNSLPQRFHRPMDS